MFGRRTPIDGARFRAWAESWPVLLSALRTSAELLSGSGIWLEESSGFVLIGHRPDIAPKAYNVVMFPGVLSDRLLTYERLHQFSVPPLIAEMLLAVNGCSFFGLTLYGLPVSMTADPPFLDRSLRAPLDLGSGQRRASYESAPEAGTLFASRNVGDDGQIGYFLLPAGMVVGSGNGQVGAPGKSGTWASLSGWAAAEFSAPGKPASPTSP